ncbi:MAG: asparagine synthase (glutamine-hydrolyzing), partial [Bacteroidia bacterium]|nr:asparagine synthase (glutamine-hydrolyzing) [Bacteroidia bacterium]
MKQAAGFNAGEKITLMSRAMRHRGPDGEGFVMGDFKTFTPYSGEITQTFTRRDLPYLPKNNISTCNTDGHFLFAHRRLAIIDLSESGHQPMCSADSKLWITFNGEIYNYIELREDLKTKGHVFLSESDTEVVIAAYKEWGTSCVEKFNGMWAFCIFDSEKQIYFASRDRLGVKPFYYLNTPELFAFASEQKAFVKAGLIAAGINNKALHNYLVNGVLESEEQNFFNNITELWPGTNLIYEVSKNHLNTHSYFHLKNHLTLTNDRLSEQELIDKINYSLEMAVKLRLRSDVEVGVCLSGGIDSSALAVIISEL